VIGVYEGVGKPSRRQRSSRTPFASSRSKARAGRSQAAGSAAPVSAALTQDGVLARERVGDDDRSSRGALLRLGLEFSVVPSRETLDQLRGDEREGDGLGDPGARERLADEIPDLERVVPVGRHLRVGRPGGDELVAPDADDLLGDVRLDREVTTPGRDGCVKDLGLAGVDVERLGPGGDPHPGPGGGRRGLDPDTGEQRALLVGVEGGTEQAVDAGRTERDVRRSRLDRVGVDRTGRHLPARPLGDEACRPVRTEPCETRLLALLEAEAGFGTERVAEGGAADADRVEDGRLDDHVRRPLPDFRGRPAHHAGDPDRTGRVGDHEGLRIELTDDVVECLEALARGRPPDDDPAVADRGGIEGMDRLAELDHDVVGGIDHVADRALTCGQEAHLDMVRRRPDPDAAHPAADEARAEGRVLDLDLEALGRGPAGFDQVRRWQAERRAGQGGHLTRQPDDRERIAAVRLHVDIEDGVAVEVEQLASERRIGREDQDPVGIAREAELIARTEHPVADDAHLLGPLDPTVARQDRARKGDRDPLADSDVRRAAHDVQGLTLADRDAGQGEPVRARMTLDREQLPDDDVPPVLAPADDPLDLHPEQGQAFGERFRSQVDVHDLAQPTERHPHRNCSRKRRSLSRKRRRSVMPCLSILIRSGPIPKAKPW
jgi:hypothetical protein